MQHITRGTLSGNGRFGPYGMILGAEGVFRILPGDRASTPPASTTSSGTAWRSRSRRCSPASCRCGASTAWWSPGPDAEWSELSTNLTLLFLGSLAAQALSYAAALGVLVLAQGKVERDAAADFIVGFFIARIPILLFQAIQAALLPKLAAPRPARASTTTSAPGSRSW